MNPKPLIISATLLALGCGAAQNEAATPTSGSTASNGVSASDFTTRDVDGKTFRLSDHLGKDVILIDFWATWCEPCLAEMPHLQRMYEQNKSKGFVVVAVSMDGPDSIAMVPAFPKRNGLTFPVVLDEDSRIASIYNPRKSAPLAVLINRRGQVIKKYEGYNPGDEEHVAEDIGTALAADKVAGK